ncbi:MAG: bifunctional transaldolase/phosoglucose isomerase [Rubrobacter sp.]
MQQQMRTKAHELADLGQAVWLDYIRRAFIQNGELEQTLNGGVRGVTSNPTIFEKAIAGSADYDDDLRRLVGEGASVGEIYESLALDDIGRTADLLRPLYESTGGEDGYVSLEVSPTLARDTNGTVAEGRRLFAALGRPNVMIKVPATPEGIPAITTLIGEGINVNVTLLFSLAHYEAVVEAYLAGLEELAGSDGDLSGVSSVASFFVSRVDSVVDGELETRGNTDLMGKAAVANARAAYARFREVFAGPRWENLASGGARLQRPLWASTGVKNLAYPDTLYVDALIGPDTVNTVPLATLQAFLDHGTATQTLEPGIEEARNDLEQLAEAGVDLDAVTRKLQDDGLASFEKSFESLMASITEKRERLLARRPQDTVSLGSLTRPAGPAPGLESAVDRALAEMRDNRVVGRMWAHDHTLWGPSPDEVSDRLGWLHSPDNMVDALPGILSLADAVREGGYTTALLLGMGGSSLAPEVFSRAFGVAEGYLDLAVLDSTDPDAVLALTEKLDPAKTLFIVSTKSGGTVETFSFFKHFYNVVADAVGREEAGAHFVAITDPGSALADTAKEYDFRATFLNDPNIGGRYSALSHFGVVPAALLGVDVAKLLDRASTMTFNCDGCNSPVEGDNRGAWLGAIMGEMAAVGRDKLTLLTEPSVAAFGPWAEQLIAESTGKEGKGILPVAEEPVGAPEAYGDDRLFVYLGLAEEDGSELCAATEELRLAGHPLVMIRLNDLYDLGGEFFRWEMATAIAGRSLAINPFDQPNVEDAKILARRMVEEYREQGELPKLEPTVRENGVAAYAPDAAGSVEEAFENFLATAKPGDYVALQAYVEPSEETTAALQALRVRLRDRLKLATTVGYGPRFLHSTGQLHKGDAGNGLFVQITADDQRDAPIPDTAGSEESILSFSVLKEAQTLGDRQALLDAGRRVIRLHYRDDLAGGLEKLA